jgi:hypothetical protein
MRLIYFHMYGGNLYNGVNKKIFAQATQLYRLGINFSLVLIGGINNSYPEFKFIQYIPLYKHYFPETPFIKRFYHVLQTIHKKLYSELRLRYYSVKVSVAAIITSPRVDDPEKMQNYL